MHIKVVKLLGNIFTDELSWKSQVNNELLPALKNRRSYPQTEYPFFLNGFKKQYVEAVFKSKMNFGIKNGGGGLKIHFKSHPKTTRHSSQISPGSSTL